MRLSVAIATTGRREVLSRVLRRLAEQTRPPDRLAVCPARDEDLDPAVLDELGFSTEVVRSKVAGLPAQRNALLRALTDVDLVIFFDDDFVPAADYLEQCEAAFAADPGLAMLTGEVLADGVYSPGIPFEAAVEMLAEDRRDRPVTDDIYNCYGCNMALRRDLAARHGVEFDENLPLYAWLEDVDFSRRMAPYGAIRKSTACRGVHLATKAGKGSGLRLGYSQVANPIYLWRKKSVSFSKAWGQLGRNLAANLAKVARPEPWVDRRGRLAGNAMAIRDFLTGRLDPRRITAI